MPGTVYSRLFGSGPSISDGPYEFFVVPDGYLAVIKCISIVYGNITDTGLDAWVQTGDLAKLVRYAWASSLGDLYNYGGVALFYGSWVVEVADNLSWQTASGTCDFKVSGYLLST